MLLRSIISRDSAAVDYHRLLVPPFQQMPCIYPKSRELVCPQPAAMWRSLISAWSATSVDEIVVSTPEGEPCDNVVEFESLGEDLFSGMQINVGLERSLRPAMRENVLSEAVLQTSLQCAGAVLLHEVDGYLSDLVLLPLGIMVDIRLTPADVRIEAARAAIRAPGRDRHPKRWVAVAIVGAMWVGVIVIIIRWIARLAWG